MEGLRAHNDVPVENLIWVNTVCSGALFEKLGILINDRTKLSDSKVWANSADPDQTAPRGAV